MPRLRIDGRTITVEQVEKSGSIEKVRVNNDIVTVEVLREPIDETDVLVGKVGNRAYAVQRASRIGDDEHAVLINRRRFTFRLETADLTDQPQEDKRVSEGPILVTAPMSGRITFVNKTLGEHLESSESLLILEAMKMENDVASPKKGTLKEIYVRPGALVKAGDKLVLID